MLLFSRVARAFRQFFRRASVERDLDDEVRHFLELATEERLRAGMTPQDAARAARVELGSIAVVKETVRRGSPAVALDAIARDARHAMRQIRRAPVFTSIAVALLAIGIGANAAFLSYLDAWYYRPLPGVEDPDGVMRVAIGRTFPSPRSAGGRIINTAITIKEFFDFSDRQQVFAQLGARIQRAVVLDIGNHPVTEYADFVTGGYLATMRPRMAVGTILPTIDDRTAAAEPTVIIGHDMWTMQFAQAPDIVGRTIRLNGIPFTIQGVLPAGFRGSGPIVVPLVARGILFPDEESFLGSRTRNTSLAIVGRLRPGVTVAQALAASGGIAANLRQGSTERGEALGALVSPMTGPGQDSMQTLETAIIGGIPLLILLIACANVSILLLGRAVVRQREIAVRLALGAGRWRVVRQLLAESTALALLASAAGVLMLYLLGGVIQSRFTELGMTLAPSLRTIAITVAFAAGTGIVFGLVPALHATGTGFAHALQHASSGLERRRTRLQRGFVIAEVAMSMALVCLTGLFVQAARSSTGGDTGMDISDRVLATTIDFPMARYTAGQLDAFTGRVRERIAALPGVESMSIIHGFPLGGSGEYSWSGTLRPAADSASGRARRQRVYVRHADVDYFRTAGIPIEGREFTAADARGTLPVAIVDEASAKRLWPGAAPVGQVLAVERDRIRTTASGGRTTTFATGESADLVEVRIVGVAGNVDVFSDLTRSAIVVYRPLRQATDSSTMTLLVRTRENATDLVPAIHAALRELEPRLPLSAVLTTAAMHEDRYKETYEVGLAGTIAGLVALFLACVGVYAVIAFGVAQRTREIGIRIALGASVLEIVVLFFRDGFRLSLIGFSIGVPLTIIALQLGQAQVFDTQMLSVRGVLSVVLVLLSVAALASWLPARRAARVNPVDALRSE